MPTSHLGKWGEGGKVVIFPVRLPSSFSTQQSNGIGNRENTLISESVQTVVSLLPASSCSETICLYNMFLYLSLPSSFLSLFPTENFNTIGQKDSIFHSRIRSNSSQPATCLELFGNHLPVQYVPLLIPPLIFSLSFPHRKF